MVTSSTFHHCDHCGSEEHLTPWSAPYSRNLLDLFLKCFVCHAAMEFSFLHSESAAALEWEHHSGKMPMETWDQDLVCLLADKKA
jgi:hypothetical protein